MANNHISDLIVIDEVDKLSHTARGVSWKHTLPYIEYKIIAEKKT